MANEIDKSVIGFMVEIDFVGEKGIGYRNFEFIYVSYKVS